MTSNLAEVEEKQVKVVLSYIVILLPGTKDRRPRTHKSGRDRNL